MKAFAPIHKANTRVLTLVIAVAIGVGVYAGSGALLIGSASAQQNTNEQTAIPRAKPVAPGANTGNDRPAVARPVEVPIPPPAPPVAKPVDPKALKDDPKKAAKTKQYREDLFTYADLLFSRKEWKLAAQQYQIFLREHPGSPNAPAAWFRLGECYLAAGQQPDALTSFNYLVGRFKKGPFVGAAAYRLATAKFTSGKYRDALVHFTTASNEAPAAELKLQASYYRARCLELLKENKEALVAYREVLATKIEKPEPDPDKDPKENPDTGDDTPENPFAERAQLSIARLLHEAKDLEGAFIEYLALTKISETPGIRHEALARGGLLAAQLGKTEESNRMLDAVLAGDAEDEWVGTAQVALIFNLYASGDHERVVRIYNGGIARTPNDIRPKLLMMVANSMRQIGDFKSAAGVYAIIENSFRGLPLAAEAIFRRLQCLDEIGDLDLVNDVDRFVKSQQKIDSTSAFIDLARLMQGEWYFQRSQWQNAAKAYAAVRPEKIPEKYHPAHLYKLGWAQTESGEQGDGAISLSKFIDNHPEDPFIPSALAKRATTQQALGNREGALKDYRTIAEEHADSDQLEFALEQVAYIHNVQREIPEMMAAYQALLEKFPETKGAAEASFYIGGGHYEQKQYAKSLEPLRKARTLDPKSFTARATEVIVLALFRLEDVENLAKEAELALTSKPPVKVPMPVLNYLGEKLFRAENYKGSERFFTEASTPHKPSETPSAVWDYLGHARYEVGMFGGSIMAFDHYLSIVQRPSDRAEGYLNKGRSLLAKGDFADADESAREALKLVQQGKKNARGRLLRGDIAAATDDHAAAAREYFITAQIFVNDPEITPQALAKAARSYRNAGDEAKAVELEGQLAADYPDYRLVEE